MLASRTACRGAKGSRLKSATDNERHPFQAGGFPASKKGTKPFELPAAIAPAISVASTHIAIPTNAVATVSVNRPCADTTVRAANQSNALNVRSWGKWGERDCGRGSCRSKAAERSKPNKCGFEFHSFPPVEDVEH